MGPCDCSLTSPVKSHAKAKIQAELQRRHWRLWRGKPDAVPQALDRLRPSRRAYKFPYRHRDILATPRKVSNLLHKLKQSGDGQCGRRIDDSRRPRAARVEGGVSGVIDQRMNRRNQMRGSAGGARHLLPVRTAVLNGPFDRSLENTTPRNTALAGARLPMPKAA